MFNYRTPDSPVYLTSLLNYSIWATVYTIPLRLSSYAWTSYVMMMITWFQIHTMKPIPHQWPKTLYVKDTLINYPQIHTQYVKASVLPLKLYPWYVDCWLMPSTSSLYLPGFPSNIWCPVLFQFIDLDWWTPLWLSFNSEDERCPNSQLHRRPVSLYPLRRRFSSLHFPSLRGHEISPNYKSAEKSPWDVPVAERRELSLWS